MKQVLDHIQEGADRKERRIALLVDPDELTNEDRVERTVELANKAGIHHIFIGGSLMVEENLSGCVRRIRSRADMPVTLFPGSPLQISDQADAILFLSLISGRNPETLIGHHVISAPRIQKAGLEVLPTGYMLIESGKPTTASYMSNTDPIPRDKDDIAACTAMAGEMLGLRLIYMDGGSGAEYPITPSMIEAVKARISLPLILGGGIRTPEEADRAFNAGADLVVVGNAIEDDASLILEMGQVCDKMPQ